jgi:hypothetical protein
MCGAVNLGHGIFVALGSGLTQLPGLAKMHL